MEGKGEELEERGEEGGERFMYGSWEEEREEEKR